MKRLARFMIPVFALAVVVPCLAASKKTDKKSKEELKFFTPGSYTLVAGELEKCGDGDFKLTGDGFVTFGALQGFRLKADKVAVHGDAVGEENCVYEGQDGVETRSDKTLLSFKEVEKCGNQVEHILEKQATVQKDLIHIDVKQTGKPQFNYACTWSLKKSSKK